MLLSRVSHLVALQSTDNDNNVKTEPHKRKTKSNQQNQRETETIAAQNNKQKTSLKALKKKVK